MLRRVVPREIKILLPKFERLNPQKPANLHDHQQPPQTIAAAQQIALPIGEHGAVPPEVANRRILPLHDRVPRFAVPAVAV